MNTHGSTALVRAPQAATTIEPARLRFTNEEKNIILDTCMGGASKEEAVPLIALAEVRGLNPLLGDCHFVKSWDSAKSREVWSIRVSIDMFRARAEETGLYAGQDEPEYEEDAQGRPSLARARIYRRDWDRPCVGVARYAEYVQTKRDGTPNSMWAKMPHNQLAKCAEALAFRKAFPRQLAKLYTPEEMGQAENVVPYVASARPAPAHDPETGEVREPESAPEEEPLAPGKTHLDRLMEERMEKRAAEMRAAANRDELKKLWLRGSDDVKAGKLPIDAAYRLKPVRDKRLAEFAAEEERERMADRMVTAPGDDFPQGWAEGTQNREPGQEG